METFSYKALLAVGSGFRLFVFPPAAELNDRIEASLIHSFLDLHLKYEAMSYR